MSEYIDHFTIPSIANIYAYLERSIDNMLTREDVGLDKGERGRLYAWYWGYWGRAVTDLLKATGESRFADLMRKTSLRLLSERDDALELEDDARGRIIPSWGTRFKDSRANEITTAGLITLPMCEYAIYTGDKEIGAAAIESLDAFIPERCDDGRGGYYFEHLSENVIEAINHTNVYGAALAHASILSGAPESFSNTALGIYQYFLRFIRPSRIVEIDIVDGTLVNKFASTSAHNNASGTVSWPYAPSPDSPDTLPSEAIWKAAVTIELPIALCETNLLTDHLILDDIGRIVSGNKLVAEGKIPQFIGGPKEIALMKDFEGSSLPGGICAWFQIDDPSLHNTIINLMRLHPEKFPRGWFGGSRLMLMALAHLIMKGQAANLHDERLPLLEYKCS